MTIQNHLLSQAFVTRACHWLFPAWYVKSHEIFGSSRSCVRNIVIIVDHGLYLPTEIPVWIIYLASGGKRHSVTMMGRPITIGAWKMRSSDLWQFRLLSVFEDKCMHFSSNEVFTTRWKILSLICVKVPCRRSRVCHERPSATGRLEDSGLQNDEKMSFLALRDNFSSAFLLRKVSIWSARPWPLTPTVKCYR